jgi:3-deoxy-D-manno-octulosonate 8-phosphate phosphatase (KDO 8-P phosphatase)
LKTADGRSRESKAPRFQAARIGPAVASLIPCIKFVVFDFDGVFTDNSVWTDQTGKESVRCSRFDGFGLARIKALGIEMLVISTETNPVVRARCQKLKIPFLQGCDNKLEALEKQVSRRQLTFKQVAYVGNDINDATCLQSVGLPIVVADAHPDVIPLSKWKTRTPGGAGAVREICDCFHRILSTS